MAAQVLKIDSRFDEGLGRSAVSLMGPLEGILTCRSFDQMQVRILEPMTANLLATRFVFFKLEQVAQLGRYPAGRQHRTCDAEIFADYCDNLYGIDPCLEPFILWFESNGQKGGEDLVFRVSDIPGWRDREFYRRFLRRYEIGHVVALGIPVKIGEIPKVFCFAFERPLSADPFSAAELGRIRRWALALRCVLENMESQEALSVSASIIKSMSEAYEGSGYVLLDTDLRVRDASREGLAHLGLRCAEDRSTIFGEIRARLVRLAPEKALDSAIGLELPREVGGSNTPSVSVRLICKPNGDCWPLLITTGPAHKGCFEAVCRSSGLSPREIEIVRLASSGQNNPGIAVVLGIAVRTVENHLRSVFAKCNVHNRTQLTSKLLGG